MKVRTLTVIPLIAALLSAVAKGREQQGNLLHSEFEG